MDSTLKRSNQTNFFLLNFRKVFSYILTIATTCAILVLTTTFYQIKWIDGDFDVSILFNKAEYMELLRQMVKTSPFVAAVTILNVFLQSCISHPQVTETVRIDFCAIIYVLLVMGLRFSEARRRNSYFITSWNFWCFSDRVIPKLRQFLKLKI